MAEFSTPDSPADGQPKKLRRITRACDYCHKRSIRCKFPGREDQNRCQNCTDFDQPCQFDRVVRRRGAKPRTQNLSNASPSTSPAVAAIKIEEQDEEICATPTTYVPTTKEWKAPSIASHELIVDLVEIYFEIVYPIFPFFHRPTFVARTAKGDYLNNRFAFGAIMAMCALVSARITDKAVYNPRWDLQRLSRVKSDVYYAAAVRECGNAGALSTANFDLLRTCALLTLTAIQFGRFREMQTHLGKYHTLVSMDGLHDEDLWPKNIGVVETEERRRLFWSMYTVDIYASIVWCGVIRCREQQSNVSYTSEIDDEFFDDTGYKALSDTQSPIVVGPSPSHSGGQVRTSSWLCGWNFTTDLWRIMEHVITNFRDKRRHKRSFLNDIFGDQAAVPASSVKDSIMAMYENLPDCFKKTPAVTCNPAQDRYGFQAAMITATVQLLRMVLLSSGGATIEDRCKIASEVVDAFMQVPVEYLQAISSPLLHHLAGIGHILGSVLEEPLTESAYLMVRVLLLALAQLLENLDNAVNSTSSADKLRKLVARLDEQMANQRKGVNGLQERIKKDQGTASSPYVIKKVVNGHSDSPGQLTYSSPSNSDIISMNTPIRQQHPQQAFAVPSYLLDEWPWNFDFMQFPET